MLSLQREATGESELLLIRGPLDSDEDLSSAQGLLASEDQALGACLSLMSDADGDGYPELIAGAPGRGSAGEAFLFSGPLRQAPELADAELRWLGEGEGDRLGSPQHWGFGRRWGLGGPAERREVERVPLS